MSVCPPSHKHERASTCYEKHRCRCGECRSAHTARTYARRDAVPVQLVSWVNRADGWEPRVVEGVVVAREETGWVLAVDGVPQRFDRPVWEVCVA